jgi:hypothetical protein
MSTKHVVPLIRVRVARWFIFKLKIQIWAYFGGPWNVKFVAVFDHLEYFMTTCNILRPIGVIYGRLVYYSHFGMFGPRKIWQPLIRGRPSRSKRRNKNRKLTSVRCQLQQLPTAGHLPVAKNDS